MKKHINPTYTQAHVSRCPSNNGGLDYAVFEVDGMFGKRKIVIDNRPKPVRIQRSRKEKQVSPNGLPIVYVGRPTKFGNPFKVREAITEYCLALLNDAEINFYCLGQPINNHIVSCYFFEKYILTDKYKLKVKKELKGKNLSCWCKVGEPCHADILLKIANS